LSGAFAILLLALPPPGRVGPPRAADVRTWSAGGAGALDVPPRWRPFNSAWRRRSPPTHDLGADPAHRADAAAAEHRLYALPEEAPAARCAGRP
jgi:hypothetical protein